jgi:putative transcriptional regulator
MENVYDKFVIDMVGKRIAGDIVWSNDVYNSLRKWRETFRLSQQELAKELGVKQTVIADYERGRRQPGSSFIKRYVSALIRSDAKNGFKVIGELVKMFNLNFPYIMDMGDFISPLPAHEIIRAVDGVILNSFVNQVTVYGYMVANSIKAISTLSGTDFYQFLSLSLNRVLVFTKVAGGRSPMIALKVAPVKPKVVVLHRPVRIDPLALYLSEQEGINIVISTKKTEEELINSMRSLLSSRQEP